MKGDAVSVAVRQPGRLQRMIDQVLHPTDYESMVGMLQDAFGAANAKSDTHPHCVTVTSNDALRRAPLAVACALAFQRADLLSNPSPNMYDAWRVNTQGVLTLVIDPAHDLPGSPATVDLVSQCRATGTDLLLFVDDDRDWLRPVLWTVQVGSRQIFRLTAERQLVPFMTIKDAGPGVLGRPLLKNEAAR